MALVTNVIEEAGPTACLLLMHGYGADDLDVLQALQPDGIGHAPRHLLLVDLLDPRLDPPQVAERIADPADPVAPEQVGHLGHRFGSGLQRPAERRIRIRDVEPQKRRGVGPGGPASNASTIASPIRNSAWPIDPSSPTTRAISWPSNAFVTNSISRAVLLEMTHGVTAVTPPGSQCRLLAAHAVKIADRRRRRQIASARGYAREPWNPICVGKGLDASFEQARQVAHAPGPGVFPVLGEQLLARTGSWST